MEKGKVNIWFLCPLKYFNKWAHPINASFIKINLNISFIKLKTEKSRHDVEGL